MVKLHTEKTEEEMKVIEEVRKTHGVQWMGESSTRGSIHQNQRG